MKYISFIFILSCSILFASCSTNNENNLKIIGSWQGAEWLIDGKPSGRNIAQTGFSFDDKGNYSFTYGATIEKGTYKVENDMLFTKPENQKEIMVKINLLTTDSLVFDMNRGGQPETLTLLKKP